MCVSVLVQTCNRRHEHSPCWMGLSCASPCHSQPAAEEDAGGAGQDPGADAARRERELLNRGEGALGSWNPALRR